MRLGFARVPGQSDHGARPAASASGWSDAANAFAGLSAASLPRGGFIGRVEPSMNGGYGGAAVPWSGSSRSVRLLAEHYFSHWSAHRYTRSWTAARQAFWPTRTRLAAVRASPATCCPEFLDRSCHWP